MAVHCILPEPLPYLNRERKKYGRKKAKEKKGEGDKLIGRLS
jgi:hypothetical protein